MRYLLPTLHDPNNSSLGFVVAICSYTFVCLLVLGFGLFGLDLIDFDAVFYVGEVGVDAECVGVVDVLAFGGFAEDAVLGAG